MRPLHNSWPKTTSSCSFCNGFHQDLAPLSRLRHFWPFWLVFKMLSEQNPAGLPCSQCAMEEAQRNEIWKAEDLVHRTIPLEHGTHEMSEMSGSKCSCPKACGPKTGVQKLGTKRSNLHSMAAGKMTGLSPMWHLNYKRGSREFG